MSLQNKLTTITPIVGISIGLIGCLLVWAVMSSGRASQRAREAKRQDDVVDTASEDSFPASDPPSSTGAYNS